MNFFFYSMRPENLRGQADLQLHTFLTSTLNGDESLWAHYMKTKAPTTVWMKSISQVLLFALKDLYVQLEHLHLKIHPFTKD